MIVTLTEDDRQRVSDLAHARNDKKEHAGVTSRKFDDTKSELQAHYEGIEGELAVAKALKLPVDEASSLKGDSGFDLRTPQGFTIEVRRRTKRGWAFALNSDSVCDFKADIGVLVWPGEKADELDVCGWTTRVHFALKAKKANYNHGERLVLEQSDLFPMDRLVKAIEQGKL